MKIAIATDTNSGITAMEGEKLGVFVLAMPVNLEETIHYEGIDITSEQLYDAMRQHRDLNGQAGQAFGSHGDGLYPGIWETRTRFPQRQEEKHCRRFLGRRRFGAGF